MIRNLFNRSLFILFLFLSGCSYTNPDGTKSPTIIGKALKPWTWFGGNGTVEQGGIVIPYHWGAMVMFFGGIISIAWSKGGNKTGWTLVGGSMGLSIWAYIAEAVADMLGWVTLVGGIIAIAYLLFVFLNNSSFKLPGRFPKQPIHRH